jgi:hypothetical protein
MLLILAALALTLFSGGNYLYAFFQHNLSVGQGTECR